MGDRPTVRLHDADAPVSPSREGSSTAVRMAAAVRAAGGGPFWAGVAALLVLVAGALGWKVTDAAPEADCSPLVVQYVLHQAATGAAEADRLDAAGEHLAAESLRRLTDVNGQPDDVRLCLILSERETR